MPLNKLLRYFGGTSLRPLLGGRGLVLDFVDKGGIVAFEEIEK